jgi:hypothetical protein
VKQLAAEREKVQSLTVSLSEMTEHRAYPPQWLRFHANFGVRQERDEWKAKAERLAKVLDEIATTGADTLDGYEAANIAEAALAEWEEEGK